MSQNRWGFPAYPRPGGGSGQSSLIDRMLEQERTDYLAVQSASTLVGQRFASDHLRRNAIVRLKEAERRLAAVEDALFKALGAGSSAAASLYRPQLVQRKSGTLVIVQLSIDGIVFSNPGPIIKSKARVWVRAQIDEAHRGQTGAPKTHMLCHVRWVSLALSRGFVKQDTIGLPGRDEYFVSYPLTVTREFLAPASGRTDYDWLVFVDLYEPVAAPA